MGNKWMGEEEIKRPAFKVRKISITRKINITTYRY